MCQNRERKKCEILQIFSYLISDKKKPVRVISVLYCCPDEQCNPLGLLYFIRYEKWKESSQQPSSASMSNHPYMTRHSLKKISQHLPSAQSSSVPNTTQPESHTLSTEDEDKK